jgi:hypothetical protein
MMMSSSSDNNKEDSSSSSYFEHLPRHCPAVIWAIREKRALYAKQRF